jgi:glycosyltransferase involved in cell wall biosynthesis
MYRFSFIIPAYNEELCIAACIRSMQVQAEMPYEIIVVDNGCTDRTAEIANQMGCIVVGEEKQGISHARNKGAEIATGDILCFIDADGVLSRNWMLAANACFLKANMGAVSGLSVYTHPNILKAILYNQYVIVTNASALISRLLFSRMIFAGNNFAIRKELFHKIGGYEDVIAEGMWLSRRFWKLNDFTGTFSPKMLLWNSPRGFEHFGFLKTLSYWVRGAILRVSQKNYTYKSR